MNDKLRQLQLCELGILDKFIEICDKYDLTYYLVGGTLLGAVRNQGFIPWDDDIDVIMPRRDYDRFAQVCQEELGAEYFYQSYDTDPNYFLTYAKLRKEGTLYCEQRFEHAQFHKGVFLDIMPLDFCPKPGLCAHFLFNVLAVMNYRGQVDSGEAYTPYEELSGKIGYFLLSFFNKKQMVKLRKKILALSQRLSSKEFVASYSGAYGYRKEVYPAHWFGQGSSVIFENRVCRAPAQYHLDLAQVYGEEYMTPQVQPQQRTHCELEHSVLK